MDETKAQNSWRCTLILFLNIFSLAPLIDFHLTSLNPMLPVIQDVYNRTYNHRNGEYMSDDTWYVLMSVTNSMIVVSAFIGSMAFKVILDHITRKQMMLLIHACNVVGSVIIALGVGLGGSYEACIVGRFILGFVLGFGLSLLPVIVTETCVPHRRQLFGAILGTCYPLGSFLGPLVGWSKVLGSPNLYYWVFMVEMIPSFVYFLFAYWIPLTPYQAYIKGGYSAAERVLSELRTGDESEVNVELKGFVGEKEEEGDQKEEVATFMEVLKVPQYRRHFIAVVILYSYVMLSGLNNIFFYSDQIFLSAGLEESVVTPASIGVFALGAVVAGIGVFTLDCIEPRYIILFASAVMLIGHALMTASIATFESAPGMSIAAIVSMCLYYSGFVIGDIIIFTMVGTLAIEKTRPVCTNVGGAACWFFAWFVGFMSSYFQLWLGAYAFLIWLGATLMVTLYIIFFIPNINGKSSEEIQHFFKKKRF